MKKIKSIVCFITLIMFLFPNSKSNSMESPRAVKEAVNTADDISKINTRAWEDSSYISPDGKKLYFLYSPVDFIKFSKSKVVKVGPSRPGHHGDPEWIYYTADGDVYVAVKGEDGKWSTPQNMGFNSKWGEYPGNMSYDEKEFYFVGNNLTDFKYCDLDIYVAVKQADGTWKRKNLGPPINTKLKCSDWNEKTGDLFTEENPHISKDGKTLYFEAKHAYQGTPYYGGWDIYYSTRKQDGGWSKPENIGSAINTEHDERQVWVDKDGFNGKLTAYFTRYVINKGNEDIQIYKSVSKDGNWLPVEHVDLKMKVAAEPSLTEDGRYMYLVAPKPNVLDLDIWYSERNPDGTWGKPRLVD